MTDATDSYDALVASAGEPIGSWEGVLATEDEWTGDGRMFSAGALRWDPNSPAGMPLRWSVTDEGGHKGARHVGWITEAFRDPEHADDDIRGRGTYFDPEFGEYLQRAGKVGLSVDVDDETYNVTVPDEALDVKPTPGGTYPAISEKTTYTDGRIRGVTAVDIPAFVTGYLEPVEAVTASGEFAEEYLGGQFIPGGGRQSGKSKDKKAPAKKAKPEKKMSKREREKALVRAILAALKDVMGQLSSAQAKALVEQIEDRAHAFIEGQDRSSKRRGSSGGKSSGGSGGSKRESGSSTSSGGSGKGNTSPAGGRSRSDSLPAGAAGIIEGVKRLIRNQGSNMKPGTRKKLQRAADQFDKVAMALVASTFDEDEPTPYDAEEDLTHAGVLLVADDTERWLLLQRALEDGDENGGLWEFPGGGIEDDETDPLEAARREFAEEVGVPVPPSARVLGWLDSGIYRLHVMAVDAENDIDIDGREVINPDDPDGDLTEAVAWWDPEHIRAGGYHIRPEVQDTDWDAVGSILVDEEPDDDDPEEFAHLESLFEDFAGNAERLRQYWTTGKGGAKIRWGTSGDFTRCVRQVQKYMPGRAEGYCANLHKRMNGFWPGDKRNADGETEEFNEETAMSDNETGGFITTDTTFDESPADLEGEIKELLATPGLDPAVAEHLNMALDALGLPETEEFPADEEDNLIASAAPVAPPDEWFEPPAEVKGPMPLTVTADGRVSGHLATWNSCHRSETFARRGQCVQPPSDPDAPMFQLGQVITASGKTLDVGRITVGGGHADIRGNIAAALEHYDDASTVVAAVRVVEDEHGIGLYGSVVPEATPEQVAALRRAPLSGDWRKERGKRRLVAAHAVVVPGFPVARGLVASVSPDTFITRGRVEACSECGEEKPTTPALVASAFRESVRSDFANLREGLRKSLSEDLRSLKTSITK